MKRLTSRERRPFAVDMILDSGAFSAWAKGESIDIDKYCEYILRNKHICWAYVNLDSIPGGKNIKRTQALVEESAAQSHKNLRYMKKKYGLNPMPVFHRGERMYWLEKMLDEGEPYIGVSPASYMGGEGAMEWLDNVFTRLTDRKGAPIVQTHGFAVASFDLMRRYPWTTCDATSWALTAAFGAIYVPRYLAGKPDYSLNPVKVGISEFEKGRRIPPDHYSRLGPLGKAQVQHYLQKEVGISVDEVSKDYEKRAEAVVFFYKKFQVAIGEPLFQHRTTKF